MDDKKLRLKNRTPLSNAIENKLFISLQKLSKTTRIPISRLLDEAVEDLLSKYDVKGI